MIPPAIRAAIDQLTHQRDQLQHLIEELGELYPSAIPAEPARDGVWRPERRQVPTAAGGRRRGNSKLTDEQRADVARRYIAGRPGQKNSGNCLVLARQLKVSKGTILACVKEAGRRPGKETASAHPDDAARRKCKKCDRDILSHQKFVSGRRGDEHVLCPEAA